MALRTNAVPRQSQLPSVVKHHTCAGRHYPSKPCHWQQAVLSVAAPALAGAHIRDPLSFFGTSFFGTRYFVVILCFFDFHFSLLQYIGVAGVCMLCLS